MALLQDRVSKLRPSRFPHMRNLEAPEASFKTFNISVNTVYSSTNVCFIKLTYSKPLIVYYSSAETLVGFLDSGVLNRGLQFI